MSNLPESAEVIEQSEHSEHVRLTEPDAKLPKAEAGIDIVIDHQAGETSIYQFGPEQVPEENPHEAVPEAVHIGTDDLETVIAALRYAAEGQD